MWKRLVAAAVVVAIVADYVNVLFDLPLGEGLSTRPNPYLGGLVALTLRHFLYVAFTGSFGVWDAAVGEDGRASTSKGVTALPVTSTSPRRSVACH